jgi:RNA polymerase II subunit A-like phosphatase
MAKILKLGQRLRYPITISKIFKKPNDTVVKKEPILQYTFKFERQIGDPTLDEERTIVENGIADWDSPTEGRIKQWRIKEGQVINADQEFIVVEETCSHEVQYAGLCALCGKDMKEQNWATEALDTERATVSMVHDNVALTVSHNQAERAEMQLQRRLLKERKLSLVVDLDQTIIHACIEPTIGEWQQDPTNPNYEAVKDVRSFQLDDGPRGLASGCWYYIKMRPGLYEFLERVAELFELHVYTMGTRAYALNIAKIVDPTQKLFGNRVISRDENGSMTAKSLQRLFPVSTNMVVVIDDRADVWPHNRPNLIKVTPYDFFKGIGDINSSFLPKREDIIAATPIPDPTPSLPNGIAPLSSPSEYEKSQKSLAKSSDENALLQLQAEEQERTLEKQLMDRPLLHLQEELDREDEEAEKMSNKEGDNDTQEVGANGHSETPSHQRHNILRDDDQELIYLEHHLTELHRSFYEQYDARCAKRNTEDITPRVIPDVGLTLNYLKSQVLKNTRIVLSGLVPLGVDVRKSEIGMHAQDFGAEIRTRVSPDVTHLVISSARPRTQKVRQAARIPSIKIVNQNWLADSLAQWRNLNVTPYLIEIHPSDRSSQGMQDASSSLSRPRIMIVQSGQQDIEKSPNDVVDDGDADDSAEDDDGNDGDDDEDIERFNDVLPDELKDGEGSPVDGINLTGWDDVDKELQEFMGSDAESDLESTTDRSRDTDTEEPKTKKRKLGEEGDGEGFDGSAGSVLAKKQRMARARTTALRNVKNAGDDDAEGSGLPTPMGTGDEEETVGEVAADGDGTNGDDRTANDGDDDDFADLEAELEAELELEAEGQG